MRQDTERRGWAREASDFRELFQIIEHSRDLEALCSGIAQKLTDILRPAETAALFLYKPEADRLVVQHALGYDTDTIWHLSLEMGEPIAGRTLESGQSELYRTPQQIAKAVGEMTPQNRALWERAMIDVERPQSIMCVPLISGGIQVGALVLESWRGRQALSGRDLELAEGLAPLVALAIDRVLLSRQVNEAKKANGLQVELMGTLSHEMRTPLASIKGYATALLLDDVQWDEQTVREYLEIISEESDNLEQIVVDLLETSRISAGLLQVERQPTLLPRLAREIIDNLARRTGKHRFLVSFSSTFPILDAAPHLVRQVLFNLVDNAIKYSPDGGLVVVHGEVRQGEAMVSVSDQGKGIAPEHLNRLFERFFRAGFVSGHHVVGSGLGLPIARSIVEAHGGRIWAESKLGEGSVFCFTLPLGDSAWMATEGE